MATVSATRLEALLGAGYHYHDQLQNELKNLVQLRRNTIRQLREIANRLDEHHKRANVSKLLGSGVRVAGGIVSIVGLALIPVSAGISVVVAGVGGGIAALGGVTAAGTDVAEFCITAAKQKDVQKVIDKDAEQCARVKALWPQYEEVCNEIITKIEGEAPYDAYRPTTWYGKLWRLLKQKWQNFKEWAEQVRMSRPMMCSMFVWDVFSCAKAMVRGIVGGYDVGIAILRGLEECCKPGPVLRLIISLVGRTTVLILDATFTAIGLIFDIVTFIRAAYDLAKGSHSAAANKLREVVTKLEQEQDSWNSLFLQ